MSLVRAELRRLRKRRIARWMLLVVVLVLAAIAVTTWVTNEKVGPATVAAAEARAQQEYEQQRRRFEEAVGQEIAACEEAHASGRVDERRQFPEDCQQLAEFGPRPEHFEAQWYLPPTFDFREQFGDMITVFAGLLALFGFVVGASFVGADWRSGAMMNLLLWRPRRLQVLGAKLVTLLIGLLGLGVLLGAAWTGGFWLVGTYRGITDTVTSGAWQSFALTGARGLTLVLVAGALGFGLASLGRHTAMAMGVAIGGFVVGVIGVSIAVFAAGVRFPEAWLWPTYLRAWMEKSVTLRNFESCQFSFGGCEPETMEITWQTTGVGLAVVVVVLVAAAMWHMRRRDVT